MRAVSAYLFLMVSFLSWTEAAVRSDVVVIEASEGVQYSVQEIAKDYLLGYIYPQKESIKTKIYQNIEVLDQNIKKIATNTKDKKTKGILSYFATQRSQIMELLNQKYNNESVETMVSFSEIFSEGSRSISNQHSYLFSEEEKMLMLTKEMMTLVGAIVKYCIAIEIDPENRSNRSNMEIAISTFREDLKQINRYSYSDEVMREKKSLNRSWGVMNVYVNKIDTLKVPALLSISSRNIQKALQSLSVHHSKSQ